MKKNRRIKKASSRRDALPKGLKALARSPGAALTGRGGDPRRLLSMIGVAAVIAATALFHVWTRAEHLRLGYSIVAAESRVRAAEAEKARLTVEEASLMSPTRIARLAESRLGLKAPEPGQVVELRRRDAVRTSIAAIH